MGGLPRFFCGGWLAGVVEADADDEAAAAAVAEAARALCRAAARADAALTGGCAEELDDAAPTAAAAGSEAGLAPETEALAAEFGALDGIPDAARIARLEAGSCRRNGLAAAWGGAMTAAATCMASAISWV